MTSQQKYEISKSIVASLTKISYYENAINRIKKDERMFISAEMNVRLIGLRSNIWADLTKSEVIKIINNRIAVEKINLSMLEKKIK